MSGYVGPALERVVVGVDFSGSAVSAAEWLARDVAPEAELMLVHAVDGAEPKVPHDAVTAHLNALADTLGRRVTGTFFVDDRPATALAAVARHCRADLILVGPYSDRPNPFGRFGSTADRLVRISPVSVLVAAGRPRGRPRQLLVPVDDADLAAVAMDWAKVLSRRHAPDVTLMHVLDERWKETYARLRTAPDAESGGSAAGWSPGDVRASARSWLERLAEGISVPATVHVAVETGTPGPAIVTAAQRISADLIVIGRRGVGRAPIGAIGSTASITLRAAPCPVLVAVDHAQAVDAAAVTTDVGEAVAIALERGG